MSKRLAPNARLISKAAPAIETCAISLRWLHRRPTILRTLIWWIFDAENWRQTLHLIEDATKVDFFDARPGDLFEEKKILVSIFT